MIPALVVPVLLPFVPAAAPLSGQSAAPPPGRSAAPLDVETVVYHNPLDSTYLMADLALPAGAGPHPGVVLLSIAGTSPLVADLVGRGYAVLSPGRRGFVAVEPMLRATFQELAADALAALEVLRTRPDVDGSALAIVAQGDDAPAAILAASRLPEPVPLVLLAPPGFPGREELRLEQRALAEASGFGTEEMERLGRFLDGLADIVLAEADAGARRSRLELHLLRSDVRLPYNAAFPNDERRVHFFASAFWRDRIAFEPQAALSRLRGPTLLLIGSEDPNVPPAEYLAAVRGGLEASRSAAWAACRIAGRTRHAFTPAAVGAVGDWLDAWVAAGSGARPAGPARPPRECLPDPEPS